MIVSRQALAFELTKLIYTMIKDQIIKDCDIYPSQLAGLIAIAEVLTDLKDILIEIKDKMPNKHLPEVLI